VFGTRLARAFARDERGVFAVIFALMAVALVAVGGASVDYIVWMNARTEAQEAADTAALGASASRAVTQKQIEDIARGLVEGQTAKWGTLALQSATLDTVNKRVTTNVTGSVNTYFVGLVGVPTLPVSATSVAERATNGKLELAMVLDNTWSMSGDDGSGSTKIQSLKAASHSLLSALWKDDNQNIRAGVVPYAEYVNVGLANRTQPWISVAADTSTTTTTTPRTCETRTTKGQTCVNGEPKTCPRPQMALP
jgi:Flp pilus assembly protein TadG